MRECGSERKRRHVCSAARACARPSPGRGGGRVGRGRLDPPPRPPRPRRRAARGCGDIWAGGPRGTLTLVRARLLRWGPRALNCKRAFKQLFVEPWTARLEGAARAASAGAGVGRGSEEALGSAPRGLSDLRVWAPAPRAHGWGAPRRGRSRRGGSGPRHLPAGPRALAQPGLPLTPLLGRPDPRPPTSGTPATRSRFSTQRLGRSRVLGLSRAEPPGRVNYSWGAWACSQDLLCLQLLRRSGEKTREKFPEQSWPRFSFSQGPVQREGDVVGWPGSDKLSSLLGPEHQSMEKDPSVAYTVWTLCFHCATADISPLWIQTTWV
ncbi:uncharacterized protein LOC103660189 [Ursus maritimus]|uniref:Uncharacterized protein LOC103660189 n=1 Tax=Ursus maritimus TaxID=29073 RepID=A0A8M1GUS4_URSMA|nr:uncharacterized protein LOC103660189 [Ursus maritimus]